MNRRLIVSLVLVAVLLAGVVLFFYGDTPERSSRDDAGAAPRTPPASNASSPARSAPDALIDDALPDSDAVDGKRVTPDIAALTAVQQRIADLKLALQASIEMRYAAEARLAESERAVEELEKFVEEIEARGEDPVDYADQGLEKLQPAFFAYQDAFAEFEQAERIEQAARDALTEANAELAALQ